MFLEFQFYLSRIDVTHGQSSQKSSWDKMDRMQKVNNQNQILPYSS